MCSLKLRNNRRTYCFYASDGEAPNWLRDIQFNVVCQPLYPSHPSLTELPEKTMMTNVNGFDLILFL
jgi:hypothetical protein